MRGLSFSAWINSIRRDLPCYIETNSRLFLHSWAHHLFEYNETGFIQGLLLEVDSTRLCPLTTTQSNAQASSPLRSNHGRSICGPGATSRDIQSLCHSVDPADHDRPCHPGSPKHRAIHYCLCIPVISRVQYPFLRPT